ncbi:MAG TPA: cupin domain-containing protein [Candidatus Binatia bacterium]|nr:cupin domain-containing protein [Candidatus Binatia bacterium]
MDHRTIENPVTGERATFVETAGESDGARSILEVEVAPGGGVPTHRHADHDERIAVLEGEIEVTVAGVRSRLRAGEHVVIERGTVHGWRNPSPDRKLRMRGGMTPGHPGFETALRVLFGLGRDGGLRPTGLPRRFTDLALVADWDPSLLAVGARQLLLPWIRWTAGRARARRRAAELLRRYGEPDRATV